MEWDEVADEFVIDGSLRDIYVRDDVGGKEWRAVFDALRGRYQVVTEGYQPLTVDVLDQFNMEEVEGKMVSIDPQGLAIHCHFFSLDEIRFDLWPPDIQSQGQLDNLCEFLAVVGRAAKRNVFLNWEGCRESPVMHYDVARAAVVRG